MRVPAKEWLAEGSLYSSLFQSSVPPCSFLSPAQLMFLLALLSFISPRGAQ